MKRYVCTVAVGFVLALIGTATASATDLPVPGQEAAQVTSFGDQSVGEQKNDADVTQAQGNGNLNLSPAIAIGGDATTTNEQGNDNYASSDVDQENDVDQSQESTQKQELDQSGSSEGCCTDQSQSGEQKTYGGDQSVEEQKNDADVTQAQGNGNVNIAPAVAIWGDAETTNKQGNDNVAKSEIDQENDVDQSQDSTQKQSLDQSGGSCCESEYSRECGCADGQSQTGEQKTSFGDQWVGEQKNDADVTQKQGNGNVNIAPAVAIWGDAKTTNKQGNDNYAKSEIDQENDVDQSQDSYQRQSLEQSGDACCGNGQSQTGEQRVYGGDQSVEKQKNDADVDQWQGNGNLNVSPAIAIFGDAETRNYQGNGNVAKSDIDQKNDVDQSQESTQKQELSQTGGSCCEPKKDYGNHEYVEKECGCADGQSQTGEQKTAFGDQWVGKQKNDADVTQKQGNWNGSFAPAIAIGGGIRETCNSTCGHSLHLGGGNATTKNAQGNGNVAKSDIDQKNDVDQSQDSYQRQSLEQSGEGCCSGSQTGEQRVYGGDQSVEKQKNDADVDQWQGNGNGSFAPAIAFGGDATTRNYQGNGNVAKSDIDQKNDVDQSQEATQKQELTQEGGRCCTPEPTHNGCSNSCQPEKEYSREHCGCDAEKSGQFGKQKTAIGDQWVGEQKNDADVTQKQGNWNGSFAPAFAFGGHQNACNSTCTRSNSVLPVGGNATTINKQGNGNVAKSDIDQKNAVDQSQDAYQRQILVSGREGVA